MGCKGLEDRNNGWVIVMWPDVPPTLSSPRKPWQQCGGRFTPLHFSLRVRSKALFFSLHLNVQSSLSVFILGGGVGFLSSSRLMKSHNVHRWDMIDARAGRSEFINLYITSRLEGERMNDKPWLSASNYVQTFTDKNNSCLFMTQLTLSTSISFRFIQEWLPNYQKSLIGFENGGSPLSIGWKLNLNSGHWMLQM